MLKAGFGVSDHSSNQYYVFVNGPPTEFKDCALQNEESLFQFPLVLSTIQTEAVYTFLGINDFISIADNVEFSVVLFDTVFAEEIVLIYRVSRL